MGGFSVRPTGDQTLTQREVDQMVQEMRMLPKRSSPMPLGINMAAMMRAKNNGYPKHMYHESLEPRVAISEEEETALITAGYSATYTHRAYPKYLYRRNMDARFEPKFDQADGKLIEQPWVEAKLIKDSVAEKTLKAMKPKNGQSVWYESLQDLETKEAIPDEPAENPAVTIARMEGELAAFRAKAS